jgi:hypothetical protein
MKKQVFIIGIIGVLFFIHPVSAQTWIAAKRLTWSSGDSWDAAIAADSNNHLHMVWQDNSKDKNFEIFYKKSSDGGASWSKYKRLTWNSGDSRSPTIAVDSNNHLHLLWYDDSPGNDEIFYKRSMNGGATWATKRLTYNSGDSRAPHIAVDSSNHLYVAWDDVTPGSRQIYYKMSKDGGATWITKRLTWNPEYSNAPCIAVDSNNHIHIVWFGYATGNGEIYYKKSTDGGKSWTTKRLTYNSGSSYNPVIATDSNNHIHVAWHDSTHWFFEIYYKKSTDGGASWTTKRLTKIIGYSWFPVITVDSNNFLHLVWFDGLSGEYEIYYKRSTSGGDSWETKRLTWNSGLSEHPDMAIDNNSSIHVVWRDNTPGNYEIYYKKGIQ